MPGIDPFRTFEGKRSENNPRLCLRHRLYEGTQAAGIGNSTFDTRTALLSGVKRLQHNSARTDSLSYDSTVLAVVLVPMPIPRAAGDHCSFFKSLECCAVLQAAYDSV